jgi:hypothetical protein
VITVYEAVTKTADFLKERKKRPKLHIERIITRLVAGPPNTHDLGPSKYQVARFIVAIARNVGLQHGASCAGLSQSYKGLISPSL